MRPGRLKRRAGAARRHDLTSRHDLRCDLIQNQGRDQGQNQGLTLIEVMVAVMILSIATVAAFRTLDAARLQIGGTLDRVFAEQVALNRAAEYRALGRDMARRLPGTEDFGMRDWQLDVTETATSGGYTELRIRAARPDGPGTLLISFLPPEDDT